MSTDSPEERSMERAYWILRHLDWSGGNDQKNQSFVARALREYAAESVQSAIAPIRMTEVIGQDGRPVAASCAIDGCQFVKSAGNSDVRQNVDTSQEMQTVRNSTIDECATLVENAKITLHMDGSREVFENAGFDILYLAAKIIRGLKTETYTTSRVTPTSTRSAK